MGRTRLLWCGLALVAVVVLGAVLPIGPLPAGMGDRMRSHRPMMWPWQDDAASQPIRGASELTISADEFEFLPAAITVDEDMPVNLALVNSGSLLHDLTIPDLGFRIVANAGQRAIGGLVPDRAGTYGFRCSIPGHAQAGMTGTLVVKAAP